MKSVWRMSAEKVAEYIIYYFGRIKLTILREITEEIGVARVARAAGVNPSSVSSAMSRNSLGDDLAFKIFKGLAKHYPELLKTKLEKVFRENKRKLEELSPEIAKLIEEKIEGEKSGK